MIDVTRSPAPGALEKGDLRDPAVLEALYLDFYAKCYLCESTVGRGGFEVDHRVPQGVEPARRLDWTNLFPICEGCNKRRKKTYPPGGLLDPARGDGCVERAIEQRILDRPGIPEKPYFAAREPAEPAAVNTAAELDHIHNDDRSPKAADLRSAIIHHQRRVFLLCLRYRERAAAMGEDERRELRDHLRALLSRRAPYTALTRAELAALGPEITALFD